jgi:acylphosphatase
MKTKSVRFVVRYSGNVQGVGFRMTALAQARGLRVHGSVRNEPDGSVLLDVEGPAADVQSLLSRIDTAMSGRIDGCHRDARPPRGIESGFRVEY